MSHDYIAIARRLRAEQERRAQIRRREIIILSVFGVCTILFALIG
jgi:hypothetical protein